ncbi:MAG: DUF72 domain-containing protein [Treponema sp.]|nr:DUF72 domain-containing protein [Treponema sp.]
MAETFIGTSGYDYPEWKGIFYPSGLKRKDFLSYYATQFNALELNGTFYSMPSPRQMLSFYERSEGKIAFSIKANRLLTHEVSSNWANAAESFKNAVRPLAEKGTLLAVLFQFPQSFHYTKENRIYLAGLISQFEGFPLVVEFRHREWIRESVFSGLKERNASLAFCDMPNLSALPCRTDLQGKAASFAGSLAYIRLHGRNAGAWYSSGDTPNGSGRYLYDYSDKELKEFVPVIQAASKGEIPTAVFFNNHPDGSGAKNAKRLKEML